MKTPITTIVLSVVILCTACSSDRGDPLASSALSLSGQNMANTVVTKSNGLAMYMALVPQLYDSYKRALNLVTNYDRTSEPVNLLGNFTGRAITTIGIPEDTASAPEDTTSSTIDPTSDDSITYTLPDDIYDDLDTTDTPLVPNLTIKYNDFSNSGRLFFAGTFYIKGYWSLAQTPSKLDSLVIDGNVVIAGDYAGIVEFWNMHVGLDHDGNLVDLIARASDPKGELSLIGRVIVTSGGQTITLYPNAVDIP